MLPKPPAREPSLNFLYIEPYRIVGSSVAGEATTIMVPELDVCFDLGSCPRSMLPCKWAAITHGHMDHVGGLAYWCSQRNFQGMGPGNIVCPAAIAPAIQKMMEGYIDLERQKTPFKIHPLEPDGMIQIKPNVFLRAIQLEHTVPTCGYTVIEKRSKLKPEYVGLPQEKLTELKDRGTEITRYLEIPLVAYIFDTAPGAALLREDVRKAQIILTECTFFEPDDKERAKIGMHLHVSDLVEWLRVCECKAMVIGHVSRRTNLAIAKSNLIKSLGREKADRVHFLQDGKANRERYERQLMDAGEHPLQQKGAAGGAGGRSGGFRGRPPRDGGAGGGGDRVSSRSIPPRT